MPVRSRVRLVSLLAILGFLPRAFSQAPGQPDKSRYNLFNPTPDQFLRELTTDRPDKTESPCTVDAGHLQVEMDLLNYTFDRRNSEGADRTVRTLAVAPINFKVGLFNHSDIQVIAETFNTQETDDRGVRINETVSGFGDVLVRWKTNFWGNEGGKSAAGVMPFVKFPTSHRGLGNDALEGGLIFPAAFDLPNEWSLGAMTEVDYLQNSANSDYHEEFINSITVGHGIVGTLAAYAEFYSAVSTERDTEWVGTVDFGLTYRLGANVQLDAGVNVGVTRSADDVNPFVGLTVRY